MSKNSKPSRVLEREADAPADVITIAVPSSFAVEAQGYALNTAVLQRMSPPAIAALLKVGFVRSMYAFMGEAERARLAAKGQDPDAIMRTRAQSRYDAILNGALGSSGKSRFKKLTPQERASRVIAKLSTADRAAPLDKLTSESEVRVDDDEDGEAGVS
jgi:hypothetical protein